MKTEELLNLHPLGAFTLAFALITASPSISDAQSLLIDCSDESGSYSGDNSPGHSKGDIPGSQTTWNTLNGDKTSGLDYGDGASASGVTVSDFGRQDADLGAINWSNSLSGFGFSGSDILGTSLMRDELFANNNNNLGLRIGGLDPGIYRVYLMIKEGNELAREFEVAIGSDADDSTTFDTDGPLIDANLSQHSIGPTSNTSNWIEGQHYIVDDIVIGAAGDKIVAVVDSQSSSFSIIQGISVTRTGDTRLFVDADRPSGGNGSSWGTAFDDLQDALEIAQAGVEIWVAEGVYYPDEGGGETDGDRAASFVIPSGVQVYGGFDATEAMLSERPLNLDSNRTILSGDIGQDDVDSNNNDIAEATGDLIGGNSYHVVTLGSASTGTRLEGFTITAGEADTAPDDNGAGISAPSIVDATLAKLRFYGNSATGLGGGAHFDGGDVELVQVGFYGNAADLGGALSAGSDAGSSVAVTNGVFVGNRATTSGGALSATGGGATLISCTVANNEGGGLGLGAGDAVVHNSILWGNTPDQTDALLDATSSHNLIQGGHAAGSNIIDADPLFLRDPDPGDGDWSTSAGNDYGHLRLGFGSPAFNAGNNSTLPADITDIDADADSGEALPLDFTYVPRVENATVDLGAYEKRVFFVKHDAAGLADGSTWPNAFTTVPAGLAGATSWVDVWVASGTYKPTEGTSRGATITLKANVALLGGFSGTRTDSADRNSDPATNNTVLSGDLLGDDLPNFLARGDNSVHVVSCSVTNALLEGFTISGGNANGSNHGGGFFNASGGRPLLSKLIFSDNRTSGRGGALYTLFSSGGSASEVVFSGNNSGDEGGAAFVSGPLTFTDCEFTNNVSSLHGGAVGVAGSTPSFTRCDFDNNRAIGGDSVGGAVYNVRTSARFADCEFTNNSANDVGGAVFNLEGIGNPASYARYINCLFEGNDAREGGGMYNMNSSPLVSNCDFRGNQSGVRGGGIMNDTGDHTYNGGSGIRPDLGKVASSPIITNCCFVGNTASSGGAIASLGENNSPGFRSDSVITNCTFCQNIAGGGAAIYNFGATSTQLKSSILWQNTDLLGADAGINDNEVPLAPESAQNFIEGEPGVSDPMFVRDPDNDTDDNDGAESPAMRWATPADNDYGDLRLQASSPAINAAPAELLPADTLDLDGDGNTGEQTPVDKDGLARIANGVADIGAFENQDPIALAQVHVDQDNGATVRNGRSWATAYERVEHGIAAAAEIAPEVWVADGIYTPSDSGNRFTSFLLHSGLAIYGGFDGDETARMQRDPNPATNGTVLSGDLNGDDGVGFTNRADNSAHVLGAYNLEGTSAVDGFTVYGGYSVGLFQGGAGLEAFEASPALRNLLFLSNGSDQAGAAVRLHRGSPTVSDCSFIGNEGFNVDTNSFPDGGALFTTEADTTVSNCQFLGNRGRLGGALLQSTGTLTIANSTFSGNEAFGDATGGGGAAVLTGDATVVNTTFANNSSTGVRGGGAILTNGGGFPALTLQNSILWGNTYNGVPDQIDDTFGRPGALLTAASANNLIQGEGGATNPLFVDDEGDDNIAGTADDNLRLQDGSPAIDVGDNAFVVGMTDLDGGARIDTFGPVGNVDLGAYEFGSGDVDGDKLPDGFELANTMPPSATALAPDSDGDADRLTAAQEFFFGLSPKSPDGSPLGAAMVEDGGDHFLELSFPVDNAAALWWGWTGQRATDLQNWTDDFDFSVGIVPIDATSNLIRLRSGTPVADEGRQQLRIQIAPVD